MIRRISLSLALLSLTACPPAVTTEGRPVAAVAPASLSFAQAGCGAAITQEVTLSNSGDGELTFSASTGTSSVFAVSPGSGKVAPGKSVALTVTATAAATATPGADLGGTLTVTTNDAAGKKEVALSGKVSGVVLTLTPTVASFGVLPVGTRAPNLPLTLTNTGNVPATITFTQPSDAQFSLAWTGAPAAVTLQPGASVAGLEAGFTPARNSASTGSAGLSVAEPTCGVSPSSIAMTGQGTNGVVGFSTTDVFFGTNGRVNCGTQASMQTFTITNSGNLAFSWTATLAKGLASPFTVTPTSGTVPANNGTVTLAVTTTGIPSQASTATNAFGDVLNIVTDVANDVSHPITLHQTANGAVLSFAPATVEFGQVPVNNTASAPFTLLNEGNTDPMVTLTSNNPRFTVDPASPLVATGGVATALTGTYAPGASVVPETAELALTIDPNEPLCAPLPGVLTMNGQGTSGSVSYSPVALDFGGVNCGTTDPARVITFRNTGNQDYTITAELGRDAGSHFVVTMTPPSGLVPTDGGTVELSVAPLAIPQTSAVTPNLYGDVLTVTTDVAGDSPRDIPLRLTAKGSIFAISTNALNFGSVTSGATANTQFTVSNTGNAAGALVFTAGQPAVFALPSNALVNGNSTSGQMGSFTPAGAMSYSDTATVAIASGTVLCQPLPLTSIALSGQGTAGNVLALSANSLTFGSGGLVPCGTTATAKTVSVTNNSSQSLTLAYALADGAGSAYTVSGPATVAAGASATVTVSPKMVPTTASTAPDAFGDVLSITATGGPVNETQTVALHQTAQGAVLTFNPTALSFSAGVGGSQSKNFTVNNAGNLAAPFTLAVGGTDGANFSVSPTSGNAPAGSSATETATFTAPLGFGTRTAAVSVATTVVRCAPLPAPLTLTGN